MNSSNSDVFYDADADADEWWNSAAGSEPAEATGSTSRNACNVPERALVRLVLSRVAATVVNGAHDLDVTVSLSSLTVHDAHMSEKLGRPCRLLTSGAATAVGVDGSSFGRSPEAIGSSPEAIGSSLVVRYRSVAERSPEYRGVNSEVHAALGPVSLAVRRPSIAALAALPSLMNPKTTPDDDFDDASGGGRTRSTRGPRLRRRRSDRGGER